MLETQELAKAVKLASYFANASSNIVRLTFKFEQRVSTAMLTKSAKPLDVDDGAHSVFYEFIQLFLLMCKWLFMLL